MALSNSAFAGDLEQKPVNSKIQKFSNVAPCWGLFEIRTTTGKLVGYESYLSNTTNQTDCGEELNHAQTQIGGRYWGCVVKLISRS